MKKHDTIYGIVEQHLCRIFIYRCLFNHNSNEELSHISDALWLSVVGHKDVESILMKLSKDPELSRKVMIAPKDIVLDWCNRCIKWLNKKELSFDLIVKRYHESIRYIHDVLDQRNPPMGQLSPLHALVHGGFHQAPRIE